MNLVQSLNVINMAISQSDHIKHFESSLFPYCYHSLNDIIMALSQCDDHIKQYLYSHLPWGCAEPVEVIIVVVAVEVIIVFVAVEVIIVVVAVEDISVVVGVEVKIVVVGVEVVVETK